MELVIVALLILLGLHVAVRVASSRTRSMTTSLSLQEALETFEQHSIMITPSARQARS